MNRVVVTRPFVGICFMQVCAETGATDEEILEVCNSENPSGTTHGWGEVVRESQEGHMFLTPQMCPVQCKDYPERSHFMVMC